MPLTSLPVRLPDKCRPWAATRSRVTFAWYAPRSLELRWKLMSQRMPVFAVVTTVTLIAGGGALAAPAAASPVAARPVAAGPVAPRLVAASPSAGSAAPGGPSAGSAAAGGAAAGGAAPGSAAAGSAAASSAAPGSAAPGSAAAGTHRAAGGVITTVAGGVGGPGPALGISLNSVNAPPIACGSPPGPNGVAFSAGHLYIADASLREVSAQTDALTTPAGTGAPGPFGAGGPAANASIVACGVAVDHAGNVVIADPFRRRVEVLPHATGTFYGQAMTAGHLYVVAGNGGSGLGGTGVPATKTPLSRPVDVAVDGAGNLVITDAGTPSPESGARVRVVAASTGTFYGQVMTAGDIYTVAGTTTGTQFSGDGGPATQAGL